jgi:N-acylneuraminate cytidylyltransferase
MPDWASFEIDNELEFEIVELIARAKLPFVAEGLSKIKLVIFDVDGVFTDGGVYVDKQGGEMLKFSRIDGKGIEMLRRNGVAVAVITQEDSAAVRERMKKMKIQHLYTGVADKEHVYEALKTELSLESAEIAYCADDLGDLDAYRKAGFRVCPKNAVSEIKRESHYVSCHAGGKGFVRDICNIILKAKSGSIE